MLQNLRIIALMMLLGGIPLLSHGQTSAGARPLFEDATPLRLTIEGPFRALSRNRHDREAVDGVLSYHDGSGAVIALDVGLRPRGNSRMDTCTYPPLRLNFRRRQVSGTVFAGQNRLKVVTLCNDRPAYRDYLALEYGLYRIYNLLTDASYRVRWMDIEYLDTDTPDRANRVRPAFLIEDVSEVAERNDLEVWSVEALDVNALEPGPTALVSLFQFMIGNTDWSGTSATPGERCCHNADVLRDTDGRAILIPFDFDQSGIVDADYARPAARLPIRSVRQRLYRGYCAHGAALGSAVERFDVLRVEIESRLGGIPVGANTRRRVLGYVTDFYEIIDDEERRKESIDSACRG